MENTNISSKTAYETDVYIKRLLTEMTNSAFKLGAALQWMKNSKAYTSLGYEYWEEYIKSLHHHRASIYNYLKVNRMWEERLKQITNKYDEYKPVVYGIGYSNLLAISHIILDRNEDSGQWKYDDAQVMEWLHTAHTNSREDIRELLGRNVNGIRGIAKLHKIINEPEGIKMVFTSVKFPVDMSVETVWKLFGQKKGMFVWRLKEE